MTTVEEIKTQSDVVQRHLDTISDLIHLATMCTTIGQMQAVKQMLETESAIMSRESDQLSGMMKQFKEERKNMVRRTVVALAIFLAIFLLLGVVSAEDNVLATNTPIPAVLNGQPVEATLEPTAAPNPLGDYLPTSTELSDTFAKYLVLIVAVALLIMGTLFYRTSGLLAAGMPQWAFMALQSAANTGLDDLQQRAKETPTPLDDAVVTTLRGLFDQWVKDETDKRGQTLPIQSAPAIPQPTKELYQTLPVTPPDEPPGLG